MEEKGIDYIQPTKFWRISSLQENWAHLGDEIDEFLEVALPCMQKMNKGIKLTSDEMNDMAMELADVQVMCNTILKQCDELTVYEKELPEYRRWYSNFGEQIMLLLEAKAKASAEARAIIRGVNSYGGELATELVKVICAAERVMFWIYENKENRHDIRKMVYWKNERRGYYD